LAEIEVLEDDAHDHGDDAKPVSPNDGVRDEEPQNWLQTTD
jgi:hypothetical protein